MSKPSKPRPPVKAKKKHDPLEPERAPIVSARLVLAILLVALGIAWIVFYYLQIRPGAGGEAGGPAFLADLGKWNYAIGFGLVMVGLMISAHPSTPMGRGRGVVVGMLGSFLLGLAWIVVYYLFANEANDLQEIPVFNDLNQYNLVVGIALMAVGFSFATKWE